MLYSLERVYRQCSFNYFKLKCRGSRPGNRQSIVIGCQLHHHTIRIQSQSEICRTMLSVLRISAAYAAVRCLSVHLSVCASVRHVRVFCLNK